jgi:hypothetical protein
MKVIKYILIILITIANLFSQKDWIWQNPLPQGNTLLDVCSIDENTIIAVGYYGTILKTYDGGSSWEIMNSGTNERLIAVYFVNAFTGYIAGGWGTLLKSSDGGKNWHPLPMDKEKWLRDVFFIKIPVGLSGTKQF